MILCSESVTTSDAVGDDSYDIDGYENLGSGYCVDESGNRLDVYYQSGISKMNPTQCASLCDQQPLCTGISLDAADETVCKHWIPNGQGPIASGYANFEWYEYENAGTSIQGADGDTEIGSISCYKKGTLFTSFESFTSPTKRKVLFCLNLQDSRKRLPS